MLHKGLADLMAEKDFKDITVKEITERADLNRGTFYLHYCDTYDLLEKVEDEIIENFEIMIDTYHPTETNYSAFVIIDQVIDYISDNSEICKTLFLQNSNTSFLEKFMNVITVKGFKIHKELYSKLETTQNEYIISFLTYGIVGILKKWFNDDMKTSKESMAKMVDDIVVNMFNMSKNIV